jgi:hypothetical protein
MRPPYTDHHTHVCAYCAMNWTCYRAPCPLPVRDICCRCATPRD